ncbi:hypothetical protein GW17_00032408 [Ensete ventricosum]|nr:hypothetical protein GW17_00032408 [Ensete ventricosum]
MLGLGRAPRRHLIEACRLALKRGARASPRLTQAPRRELERLFKSSGQRKADYRRKSCAELLPHLLTLVSASTDYRSRSPGGRKLWMEGSSKDRTRNRDESKG